MNPDRSILGVDVAVRQSASFVQEILNRTAEGATLKVAFANANLLNMGAASAELTAVLRRFVVVNDGSGVNLASRLLGHGPFPDNLNGTDFIPFLLDSSPRPLRLYLLGGSEEVVQETVAVMNRRWPRHVLAGFRNGYFKPEAEDGIRAEMVARRPDVILVALGNGKQEHFAAKLEVPGAAVFGVGALFDFLSGRVERAPSWMRRLGIEWIYRLLLEPGRLWRRYVLGNPLFLWRVVMQRLQQRHSANVRGDQIR